MRKDRRNLLLAAMLAVALMAALAWLIFRNQEPFYQGKGLREWLQEPTSREGGVDSNEVQAIRQIGTNGIPTLLRMLRAHDSKFKLKLVGLAQKQHLIKFNFVTAEQQKSEALFAFLFLGNAASNAVPALIQMYEESDSTASKMTAAAALTRIGPASSAAIPVLLRIAADTNASADLRDGAALTLGLFRPANPELVVPVLIKCLKDPEWDVRFFAALALSLFGVDARAAVPALVDLLNDTDTRVTEEAEQALKAIDPEAAAKAGIK